jgi:hypothetical protein
VMPAIAAGNGLTVTTTVFMQPVLVSVKEMIAVPWATPKTTPLAAPTEATVGSLLDHVPAPVISVSVVVLFTQTLSVPPGIAGKGFTVICSLLVQPVGAVYVMNGLPEA